MPISKKVVCSYESVCFSNEEIVKELNEIDAKEVIKGLLEKFPKLAIWLRLAGRVLYGEAPKLFPEPIKTELIKKYKNENKSIENFIKTKL